MIFPAATILTTSSWSTFAANAQGADSSPRSVNPERVHVWDAGRERARIRPRCTNYSSRHQAGESHGHQRRKSRSWTLGWQSWLVQPSRRTKGASWHRPRGESSWERSHTGLRNRREASRWMPARIFFRLAPPTRTSRKVGFSASSLCIGS